MPAVVKIDVKPLKKLRRELVRAQNRAVTKVAKPLIQIGRSVTPIRSGALKMSIGKRQYQFKYKVKAVVGVRKSYQKSWKGKVIIPKYYYTLVRIGTKARTTKAGQNRGSVKPNDFLAKMWSGNRRRFQEDLKAEMGREIKAQLSK